MHHHISFESKPIIKIINHGFALCMTTSADILAHRAKQLAPCIDCDIAIEIKKAKRRAYLGVSLA